jgi:hypothetical protein
MVRWGRFQGVQVRDVGYWLVVSAFCGIDCRVPVVAYMLLTTRCFLFCTISKVQHILRAFADSTLTP